MLYWAAFFFVVALVSAGLAFAGVSAGAAAIAKLLFWAFLTLGALALVLARRAPA